VLVAVLGLTESILAADDVLVPEETPPHLWETWWAPVMGMVMFYIVMNRRLMRLNNLPRFPWTFRPGTGLMFFVAALCAGVIGSLVGLWVAGPLPEDASASLYSHSTLRVITIVTFCSLFLQGVVLMLMPGWRSGQARGLGRDGRAPVWSCIMKGVVAIIIVLPIVMGLATVLHLMTERITGEAPNPLGHEALVALVAGRDSAWFWAKAALVVLAAPVIEEVLYRGLLQESLRRHRVLMGGSPWGSIIGASIFFTFMHAGAVQWQGLLPLFVLSMALGCVFARTGRLVAPITMHIIFNGFNFFFIV
jgi:membrane protease YdiL (CAAX protease family)